MVTIVQEPADILREVARPVAPHTVKSPRIQKIIKDMRQALNAEADGVAIAAPQIGIPLRIIMIAKRASTLLTEDTVFINPEIIRSGKKKELLSEGCLSVRWKYGLVKRATSATVRALNKNGNECVTHARGLLAQIFQHEVDHLNGILFIDKAKNIEDLPPPQHEHRV
ncbi:MAG TPA: peptide deformylase [Candidatus Paceibacterota bacterium]|nr:peptide deformylase [Candidatus Paceibacterota bacterium]